MEPDTVQTLRSLLVLLAILVSVPALWRIFGRAGFAGAWGLLGLVPGMGLLLAALLLALRDWPATSTRARREGGA